MNTDLFAKWLETNSNLKPYSIGRYSRAIETITSELEDYGLQRINLFNLNDTALIDNILVNPQFKKRMTKEIECIVQL